MNISHEAIESIEKVQTMRALREAKHQWRAHYRSMPPSVAPTPVRIPCLRIGVAEGGAYNHQGVKA
jgi:hypothetical protein